MLQSGSGVDVLEVRDITVGPFSTNGWLYDMAAELKGWDGWEDLTDERDQGRQGRGRQVVLSCPYGFYGLRLFYRTDLVEEAGFDGPPASWDDLLEQATAIQDPAKNQYGYAFRGGTNANSNVVAAIEAYVADEIDERQRVQADQRRHDLLRAGGASTRSTPYFDLFEEASPPSSVAWGYPEMVEGFSNGSTGFLLQDPEVIATVEQSKTITEDQWTTAPLLVGPTGKAVQPLATAGWGIAEASEHKEEAVEADQVPLRATRRRRSPRRTAWSRSSKAPPTTRSTRPARGPATSR